MVLVEPKDAFVHNIAALRRLVDDSWAVRVFYPYATLLRRGQVVRGRVADAGKPVILDDATTAGYQGAGPMAGWFAALFRTGSEGRTG